MLVLKDVLYLVQTEYFGGGVEEFQPDKNLTDTRQYYPSHMWRSFWLKIA